jgi:phosphohistidine phosphatase
MKQLTLLRHAKSSRKDTSLADFDRPLNKRGREDAPRMGRWLRQQELAPDLVLVSPAARTRATAEAVLESLGVAAGRVLFREDIYEAEIGELLEMLRALDDASAHVLLVGHNPGLTDLWNHLSTVRTENIPTCGAFSLNLSVSSWKEVGAGSGKPVFRAIPREIAGLQEKKAEKPKKTGKKGKCLKGKSEAAEEPGNFKCEKCGAVSAAKGRLCHPGKIKGKKKE